MFEILLASRRRPAGRTAWASTAAVLLFHTALGVAAVRATRREAVASVPVVLPPVLWAEPLRSPSAPRTPEPGLSDVPGVLGPGPIALPAVELEPGPWVNPLAPPAPPTPSAGDDGRGGSDGVVPAQLADERPELLAAPPLSYPEHLRRLGIEGRVVMEVVVDTLGRVEPESVRIFQAGDPGFADAVRRVLAEARFRPARVQGRPVRVLVRIPFEFRLTR
ncbi:MAG TPA: energy transducer TonB [Gemmatimonadales bacterium]|nr:energy transducer TonB [Gemmatimonadales bacterium]